MQLCLALDLESQKACLNLLEQLKGLNLWIKLGLRGFIREGPSFLERIKNIDSGFKLFFGPQITRHLLHHARDGDRVC
ncbi:Orotidine 5'-phosphate decarboxylase [Helicobacter bizzozeronii CCUG 35545]|nr:Orotidine 5'-phosphate decarboxylase [Helicobacter bizzozeronii CCUG 35545]